MWISFKLVSANNITSFKLNSNETLCNLSKIFIIQKQYDAKYRSYPSILPTWTPTKRYKNDIQKWNLSRYLYLIKSVITLVMLIKRLYEYCQEFLRWSVILTGTQCCQQLSQQVCGHQAVTWYDRGYHIAVMDTLWEPEVHCFTYHST
jgi:hypothetical protein